VRGGYPLSSLAEVVAELAERSLYVVTAGELGTTARLLNGSWDFDLNLDRTCGRKLGCLAREGVK